MKKRTVTTVAMVSMIMLVAQMVAPAVVSEASPATRGGALFRTARPVKAVRSVVDAPGRSKVMHVQDITMSWGVQQGNKYFGKAVVTVADAAGHPVSGATVYGQWSGAASDSDTAVTGGDGQTEIMVSDDVLKGGSFTFCVTDVTKSSASYDAGANVETCNTVTAPPGTGPAKWTFMVYIVGDNNLEAYVTKDIETELGYSNEDVNVVALADRHPGYDTAAGDWTQTLLFYITLGMEATLENALADWGERNMGDPQTLIDFVQWSKVNYPAERYALILWNHGWAWRPDQSMWDETDGDTLDPHEIEVAMGQVGPIDLVANDACEGMAIEMLALWRELDTQAFAGSQEDLGMNGLEYELVLPALQANPDMTPEELAYRLAESSTDWTSSAAALNTGFDVLLSAVDDWAAALLTGLPAYRKDYDLAWRNTKAVADRLNKDLYDAAQEISSRVDDPVIQARSQAVMAAFDAVMLYEWHRGIHKDLYGIGIFWPKEVQDLDEPSSPLWNDFEYYRDYLVFSELTHWDEFLDAYVNGQ
jgi:hypothetical protein